MLTKVVGFSNLKRVFLKRVFRKILNNDSISFLEQILNIRITCFFKLIEAKKEAWSEYNDRSDLSYHVFEFIPPVINGFNQQESVEVNAACLFNEKTVKYFESYHFIVT